MAASKKPEEAKIEELHSWFFRLASVDTFGITVEGFTTSGADNQTVKNWATTKIKKVTNNGRILETDSGSVYKLIGDCDRRQLKEIGFPDALIKLFCKGFPDNWETLLQEYWEKWKTTNPLNANNWFEKKISVENKRRTLGVSVVGKRQSTIVPTKPPVPPKKVAQSPTSIKLSEGDSVRRSPRFPNATFEYPNKPVIPATPYTAASMRTAQGTNEKHDVDPAPRFVPQSENLPLTPADTKKFHQSMSIGEATSTPRRRKASNTPAPAATPKATPGSSPRRRSTTILQSPNSEMRRITRSASVQRTSQSDETPTKKTTSIASRSAKKNVTRTQSAAPASKAKPSPAKTASTPRKQLLAKVIKTEIVEKPFEQCKNSNTESSPEIIVEHATKLSAKDKGTGKQMEKFEPLHAMDSDGFKAPRPGRAQSIPSKTAVDEEVKVLAKWHIKFLPGVKSEALPPFILCGEKLCVNKFMEEEPMCWHSTPILEVIEESKAEEWLFRTARSEYKIRGAISSEDMGQQGFSKDFVEKFRKGFPPDWRKLLWSAFRGYNSLRNEQPNIAQASRQQSTFIAGPHLQNDEYPLPAQEEISVATAHGRQIKKTSEPPRPLKIAAERDGGRFVKQKKRTLNFSPCSSDDEAVIRTWKDIRFDHKLFTKPANNKKRSERPGENNREGYNYHEKINWIAREKRKLQNQIVALDDKLIEIMEEMSKKIAHQQRALESEEIETGAHRICKPKEKYHRKQVYTITSSEEETSDNDSVSTESDDDYVSKKISKRVHRAQPIQKRKLSQKGKFSKKMEPSNPFDELNESEETDDEEVQKPQRPKKRSWRQNDLDKLKHVISVSKIESDDDWKNIAAHLGDDFIAEDCKDIAIKKLRWMPRKRNVEKADGEAMLITARQGTQAYKIQADEQSRKYMLGAGSQEFDCFQEQAPEDDDMVMTNLADMDESILEALRTPSFSQLPKRAKRDGPVIPQDVDDGEDTPRLVRKSMADFEFNTEEREAHQRYLHHITNDRSYLNVSRAVNRNQDSFMDRSRAIENIGRKIDKIKKAARTHGKRKHDSDIEEEELED